MSDPSSENHLLQHLDPSKKLTDGRPAGPEPGPSCVSFSSDWSMDKMIDFKGGPSSDRRPEKKNSPDSAGPEPEPGPEPESGPGPGPGPSGVSFRSERSTMNPDHLQGQGPGSVKRVHQESSEGPSGQSVQQLQTHLESVFKLLEENFFTYVRNQLKKFKEALSSDYPECLEGRREDEDEKQKSSAEAFLRITQNFLRMMEEEDLADSLQSKLLPGECRRKLQSNLKERFQQVFEGIAQAGNPTLLNRVYTELYITEGGTGEVNQEHEVRQMEAAARRPDRAETSIRQEDIFKAPPGRHGPIRAVLTKGVAGIGKTVLTQKFSLDWAEGKANQDIHFLFPFTFRELNVLKEKKYSLMELVHHYFHETKEAGITSLDGFQVVFIFDGLDERRPPLDFHKTPVLTDETESVSVDVLLTNLIRGKLLPSARLWITTRPAAANQIPPECVSMVTEVRGFTDPQKEDYFRRRFTDEKQASIIISHIKTSRSLHIMCHIPVFCWITAGVLEDLLKTREGGELPKSLTETYIHFLVVQSKVKKVKYEGGAETESLWSPESREMIESLGKLAFEQLQKGNLIFYESDLEESSIDIRAASVYSGVFTQIFREERGLYQDKMFCFVHLSVQEFLAALHVHLRFIKSGVNLLKGEQPESRWSKLSIKKHKLKNLHQSAVGRAIQSPNGHLDLFLRFLLGLSLQTSQNLLGGLLTQTGSSSGTSEATVKYIKKKIGESDSAEKTINLFHCLNELNDRVLEEEIQRVLRSGRLSTEELSPAQWSALVFILLSSEEDLDVFDLSKYSPSEEVLLRLLPVVRTSKKVLLRSCDLSERSCGALASVLNSQSSSLTELDLSNNHLKDPGVKVLSAGLESPHCRLEALSLRSCNLSERSCGALASVLSSQSSSLTELDLSNNDLKDPGVKVLSAGLESPHCRLEALRLSGCLISEEGCSSLASVLISNRSSLTELDLSNNHLKDPGVKVLSAGLESPHCRLEALSLRSCNLSERSCGALASVLSSQSSSLTELDLSNNHLKDPGVQVLSAGLESRHCRLEALRLSGCRIKEEGCSSLAAALSSNPSSLTELDLSNNHLKDPGVKVLSAGLESPHCRLKALRLSGCLITEEGCSSLASVLSSNPSSLTELDLSNNDLKDPGVKVLSAGLESPHCRLEALRLSGCLITEEGCSSLASALRSNPSRLTELDLSYNHPGDSGVERLSSQLDHPHVLRAEPAGVRWLRPGLRKYSCELTVDPNTVNRTIRLSDNNRKMTHVEEVQSYPDHPDRFECWSQLLCRDVLTGRCYWEVQWRGEVYISVSYRRIRRRGDTDSLFGWNDHSWSLICKDVRGFSRPYVRHNSRLTSINQSVSHRVGVYVDCPAGTLSFYSVSSDGLIHLHTFNTTFTEPLNPGFGLWSWSGSGSSVSLCSLEEVRLL